MGLLTAIGLYGWGRRRGRRHEQEHQRKLDEQAERQRRRAPEPGPEAEVEQTHYELRDDGMPWLAAVLLVGVSLLLVVLGMTINAWITWIGALVLFAAIGVVVAAVAE